MSGYIDFAESYDELKEIDNKFKERYASIFNIWEEEPVEYFEDVVVFNKRHSKNNNPIGLIMKEYQEKTGIFWNDDIITESLTGSGIASTKNSAKAIAKHKLDWKYRQPEFLTEKQYDLWKPIFNWEHTYEELKALDDEYKKQVASTFNLWQKKKTKSNILKYAKDYPSLHPTQKPVLLLEDLVKTFSNEGDLVVDLTMGSGSTGVACKNTGRKFIGIEMDDEYFNIAKERIETHEQQLELV
jgi:site-specific DNA-methyltransferase (adenine-specific)